MKAAANGSATATDIRAKAHAVREVRFTLDQEDFKKLIRGQIVKKDTSNGGVAFFLQDIGQGVILSETTAAYNEFLDRQSVRSGHGK